MTPPLPALLLTVSALAGVVAILVFGEPRERLTADQLRCTTKQQLPNGDCPERAEMERGR